MKERYKRKGLGGRREEKVKVIRLARRISHCFSYSIRKVNADIQKWDKGRL